MSIVSSGTAAILEKYAALNNGIDECRRDSIQVNAQLEAIRNEITDLIFKCNDMNDQIQKTKIEKEQLENDLKQSTLKKSHLQNCKDEALSLYDKTKRELQFVQHLREEGRLQFMEECKKYREACKRIRVSALVATGTRTGGEAHGVCKILPPDIDDCSYCSEDKSPSVQETFPHIEYTKECDSHGDASSMSETDSHNNITVVNSINSPYPKQPRKTVMKSLEKWITIDPEIKVAQEKESSAFNQLLLAKRELDQVIAERDERSLKAEARMDNFDQQQAQLERIKKDVESMELELLTLEKNTKEARLMSEGFTQGMYMNFHKGELYSAENNLNCAFTILILTNIFAIYQPLLSDIRRRKALRESDKTDRNKRFQSSSNQGSISSMSRTYHATSQPTWPQAASTDSGHHSLSHNPYRKSDESSTVKSYSNQSSTRHQQQTKIERQHPHRAGKIRVDKQFQVHLEVSALLDDDDTSSSNNSSSDESSLHKNQRKTTSSSSKSKNRTGQSSKENKSRPMLQHQTNSRFSDSDNDDHELLDYVPFAKASRKK